MPHRTFTTKEAAEYLHLPRKDIDQLVRQNEIPFEQTGQRIIFRKIDLDAWASRRIFGLSEKKLTAYHKTTSAKTSDLTPSRAIISDLVKKNAVKIELPSKTKPSLLRDMVALADMTGLVLNTHDLLQSLELRESLCSTAMPDGLALLHPRHHAPYMFEESFVAFGRTIRPIPFGAPDGGETDIFFLVCCQDDRIHLHALARLCLMCRQKKFLYNLRQAIDAMDAYSVIKKQELDVIKHTR